MAQTAAERVDDAFAKARQRRMAEDYKDPGWPEYERQECAAAIDAAVVEAEAIGHQRAINQFREQAEKIRKAVEEDDLQPIIDAAVAEERARCAAVARDAPIHWNFETYPGEIQKLRSLLAEAIERGDAR
jgi:hypothetical protein